MDVRFEESTHTYTSALGVRVPSVTEIISAVGCGLDTRYMPAEARERGRAVHRLIAQFNADDEIDYSPEYLGYLAQWAWAMGTQFHRLGPPVIEHPIAHPFLGYAGTPDCVWPEAKVIVDAKTGADDPSYDLQLGGYCRLWIDRTQTNGWRLFVVALRNDAGGYPAIREVNAEQACRDWLNTLSVYQWRVKHGRL